MNSQPANTNSNLVLNGSFEKAYEIWKRIGGTGSFQVKDGTWGETPIRYAEFKNGASIFQSLKVEVKPAEGARYHLSFLYENTYKSAQGRVLIGKKGAADEDKLSIDLPPTGVVTGANPLALDFHELARHLPLDLVFDKGDELDVTLISPRRTSSDPSTSEIRLTRIELHVELAPLQLLGLVYDTQPVEPGEVLHLCLGATLDQRHQLEFEVDPDSDWMDTDAALWAADNPHEAIITEPELGTNQGIELPWSLDCPELEGDAPYLSDLNIYSKYTADPYPIAVSLGHHRLELNVLKGATFWPVLEYEQSVPLEVQVLSYYTDKPVSGIEVTWRLGGDVLYVGTSDGEGKTGFDYIPDSHGRQTIDVSVPSPYYEDPVVQKSLDVLVLEDDPLKAVGVRFEHGDAAVWGEKTGYPNRGSTYSCDLIIPADSPLQETQIAVGWSEGGYGPDDLDITSVPDFGELKDVAGDDLEWTLDCGDVLDARFGLFLSSPMLLRDSRDNAMSLALNNLKIGEVREANKSPAVDEGDSVYCMVQVLTQNNEPALYVQVNWFWPHGSFTSYTGEGGWASAFDKPTAHGHYEMTAQVKVPEGAAPLTHPFPIVALATSGWKDDIDFFFDDQPIDNQGPGILCWRGKSHTFGIAPKHSDSPFINQMITLNWRKGVVPDLELIVDPPFGTPVLLTQEGLQWVITSGSTRSGIFELEVESECLPRKRELTGRLMSSKFDEEVTLVFDQMPSPIGRSTLYPCIGAIHQLTLLPHAFSPLQGLEVLWNDVGPSENVEITPDMRTLVPMTAGGIRYTFDCSASSEKAEFGLFFRLYRVPLPRTSNQFFQLDHNKLKVGAVRQAAIDPVLSKDECAWLAIQYLSWFTGLPAAGMPVQWSETISPLARSETDSDGWTGHDHRPQVPGMNLVNARSVSPYDGSSAGEEFEVRVLAQDPWQDLSVESEDNPFARPWAAKTFFPRHNIPFFFLLSANEDSYWQGQQLALGITGTGACELGLTMSPVTFGQWRPLQSGLPFTLTASDEKDGGFSFQLAASRLLALSPRNAVSLGAGSRAIKMSAISNRFQLLDWGSVFEAVVTVVSALSGKPIVGMSVDWEGPDLKPVSTRTNFYGVARVSVTPAIVGLGQVIATVGDNTLSLSYTVNYPREILEMTSPELVGYPGEEVSAQVTVVAVGAGGKVLEDVEVMWRFEGVPLAPTVTGRDGKASVRFKLPLIEGDRALTATVTGGELGWAAAQLVFTVLEDEWVVGDVTSESSDVYRGDPMTAQAKVVTRRSGLAVADAEVSWRFTFLELLPSHTDAHGVASVEFTPVQLGEHTLIACVDNGTPDSKSLRVNVLDPVTSPNHATIKSVVASRESITPREFVVFTADIVSTVTQAPMPGREVFVSVNNSDYGRTTTDSKGQVSRTVGGWGGQVTGYVSFDIEVNNPGGTKERQGKSVLVELNVVHDSLEK